MHPVVQNCILCCTIILVVGHPPANMVSWKMFKIHPKSMLAALEIQQKLGKIESVKSWPESDSAALWEVADGSRVNHSS